MSFSGKLIADLCKLCKTIIFSALTGHRSSVGSHAALDASGYEIDLHVGHTPL